MPTASELIAGDRHVATGYMLLQQYLNRNNSKPRSKAEAVERAKFDGMCMSIDRLGLAHTTTEVEFACMDAVRAAEPRPAANLVRNDRRHEWDVAVARDIARRLGWVE